MAAAGNFAANFWKMPQLTYVDARRGEFVAKRLFFRCFARFSGAGCAS